MFGEKYKIDDIDRPVINKLCKIIQIRRCSLCEVSKHSLRIVIAEFNILIAIDDTRKKNKSKETWII